MKGGVYFKGDEYITIEIGTNPKSDDLVPMHKKHHILLVCYNHLWHELEYVKKENPNTIPLELIPILLSLLFAACYNSIGIFSWKYECRSSLAQPAQL